MRREARTPAAPQGLRLDLALVRRHPELSRRKARAAIEKGQVTLDGRTVREPGRMVAPGSDLRWDPQRPALPRARLSLPMLHADETIVIVDKPAGLLSVPTSPEAAQGEDTALGRVQEYARHLHPRRPYARAAHRLDRDTSGALAFALDPETHAGLRQLFRAHRIERVYAAIVEGQPVGDRLEIDLPIHDEYRTGRRRVARGQEPARPARTSCRVIERFKGAALLEVTLETGRQHQIRVHLAHHRLPVLGDTTYRPEGLGRPPLRVARQMLHARRLAFIHPRTGQKVVGESPLPADFEAALAALRDARRKGIASS